MQRDYLEADFLKGEKLPDVEHTHGAHYYVFSRALTINSVESTTCSDCYDEATATVILPKTLKVGNRRAFISLGMGSAALDGSTVDLGLANDGDGWYPIIYDGQFRDPITGKRVGKQYPYKECKAEAGATRAIIFATCLGPNQVRLNVIFQDDNGNPKGTCWKIETVTSTTWGRFHRFASLMNNGVNSSDDGTCMLGGAFTGLYLHHKTDGYQAWGIPTDEVTNFWIVGPELCKVTDKTTTGEKFSINNNGG